MSARAEAARGNAECCAGTAAVAVRRRRGLRRPDPLQKQRAQQEERLGQRRGDATAELQQHSAGGDGHQNSHGSFHVHLHSSRRAKTRLAALPKRRPALPPRDRRMSRSRGRNDVAVAHGSRFGRGLAAQQKRCRQVEYPHLDASGEDAEEHSATQQHRHRIRTPSHSSSPLRIPTTRRRPDCAIAFGSYDAPGRIDDKASCIVPVRAAYSPQRAAWTTTFAGVIVRASIPFLDCRPTPYH